MPLVTGLTARRTERHRDAAAAWRLIDSAHGLSWKSHVLHTCPDASDMLTAGQLRAARALLGIDQKALAELAGLSVPTIQRMEASEGVIRGNVDSLMKVVGALQAAGLELLGPEQPGQGRARGLRLRQ